MLREMRTSESMVEDAQTVRAKEFLQLRQQIGENFDGGMQIVLVDVVNDAQQQSPNSGAEPAVDFIANNVVDNDVLNSLLISSTQMPSTDYKYYSRTQSTELDFSVVNVPDSTEDKILHNDLPLPSESLINVETRSSPTPTATFSRGSLIDNSLNPRGTLTTAAAAKTLIEISSLQHLSTRDDTISSYIGQDTNSTVAKVHNSTIYNLSLGEANNA
ncbi:unnamed protein product [Brugia pahangi]|uniref:Uncharacterized protein n=1 Tax=Brugia pahangi TaxID=6280 RepID=A0A0N4TAM8_BRUPA|nr:unnamed protein product [Brugia pahangi]